MSFGILALLSSGFGVFVAARQSWSWYPPEFVTCGRDFYGMIEHYSLQPLHSHDLPGLGRLRRH